MIHQESLGLCKTAFMLAVVLGGAGEGWAQEPAASYPRMAPMAEYLMSDQSAEVALARSAAPEAIARDATVLVLKPHGYETAVKGTNGFVCAVERSWMSPFDSPEFWNPKMRGPICFNPQAARSVLPLTYKRTEWVLAGISKTQIAARLREAVEHREMPALEAGAMCYMLSHEGNLGDKAGHWHPHLMFYGPKSPEGADWGADVPRSPVYLSPQFQDSSEPLDVYMILAPQWSDGTPAPPVHGQ